MKKPNMAESLTQTARELERAEIIIKLMDMLKDGKTLEQAIDELKNQGYKNTVG